MKISQIYKNNISIFFFLSIIFWFFLFLAIVFLYLIFYTTFGIWSSKYKILYDLSYKNWQTTTWTLYINNTSSEYPQERKDVYQRAYRLWITTIPNIEDANLKWVLYRKIAAKMMSEFAINVVWIIPDKEKTCEFTDISKENWETQQYIKLACQLWIMWLDYYGNPDTVFNPNYYLTRDQFVSILSRIIFGNTYNLQIEEYNFFDKTKNFVVHTLNNICTALNLNIRISTPLDWYTKHLEAIKKLHIITDYRPYIKEFRIYALLIMYNIEQQKIQSIQSLEQ